MAAMGFSFPLSYVTRAAQRTSGPTSAEDGGTITVPASPADCVVRYTEPLRPRAFWEYLSRPLSNTLAARNRVGAIIADQIPDSAMMRRWHLMNAYAASPEEAYLKADVGAPRILGPFGGDPFDTHTVDGPSTAFAIDPVIGPHLEPGTYLISHSLRISPFNVRRTDASYEDIHPTMQVCLSFVDYVGPDVTTLQFPSSHPQYGLPLHLGAVYTYPLNRQLDVVITSTEAYARTTTPSGWKFDEFADAKHDSFTAYDGEARTMYAPSAGGPYAPAMDTQLGGMFSGQPAGRNYPRQPFATTWVYAVTVPTGQMYHVRTYGTYHLRAKSSRETFGLEYDLPSPTLLRIH